MLRDCDVCGIEYNVRPADLKRGWGLCCSIKCKEIKKSKEKAVNQWHSVISKYSKFVNLPETYPVSVVERFTIYCVDHGKSTSTIQQILKTKFGCPKCGMKTIVYKGNTKQCNTCKEWKDLSEYADTGKVLKSGNKKLDHRCKACKAIAKKEYSTTLQGRQTAFKAVNKYKEKKKQELLNQGKGPYSNVTICKCKQCDKLFTKKGTVIKNFCSIQCTKDRRLEISRQSKVFKLKDYLCKVCKIQYKGKCPGCCLECSKKKIKMWNKAHNKKRRAALRTVAVHAVVDTKVFERDKWKCKICGVKVQKDFIYRDDAAELDHIVPVSLGGPHSYSNTQTACRKCNQEKSNKYYGQLVLCL